VEDDFPEPVVPDDFFRAEALLCPVERDGVALAHLHGLQNSVQQLPQLPQLLFSLLALSSSRGLHNSESEPQHVCHDAELGFAGPSIDNGPHDLLSFVVPSFARRRAVLLLVAEFQIFLFRSVVLLRGQHFFTFLVDVHRDRFLRRLLLGGSLPLPGRLLVLVEHAGAVRRS
jgi:hypothetical protein